MLDSVPLIVQLSNPKLLVNVAELLGAGETSAPILVQQLCCCGCGQAVANGRKFVNQAHYDRSRSLASVTMEQLIVRFRQGVRAPQLAQDYSVALSTVYRLIRKNSA